MVDVGGWEVFVLEIHLNTVYSTVSASLMCGIIYGQLAVHHFSVELVKLKEPDEVRQ